VAPAVPDWSSRPLPPQPGKPPTYDVYVGGFGDEIQGGPVLRYAKEHDDEPGHNAVYFPWDTSVAALAKYLDSLPPGSHINLIGHSYGGDTAANVALLTRRRIDVLITIDPVSRRERPSYADVRSHVGQWIDVNAATVNKDEIDNWIAGWGGAWDTGPQDFASSFVNATANHKQFSRMMRTPGPSGLTPEQVVRHDSPSKDGTDR
jgi:pimeloyl-ACP methyl ester carboxylesterase